MGYLAWSSLNANRARIYGKISELLYDPLIWDCPSCQEASASTRHFENTQSKVLNEIKDAFYLIPVRFVHLSGRLSPRNHSNFYQIKIQHSFHDLLFPPNVVFDKSYKIYFGVLNCRTVHFNSEFTRVL